MKVLQVIQKLQLRGAEVFACQLASELRAKGFHVDIAYLFKSGDELHKVYPNLNFINLEANQQNRLLDYKAFKEISKVINKGKYDIVQANAGDTLKYTALSKFIFGWNAKLVFRNANKMSGFIKNKFHAYLNKLFLQKYDYFISVSENCRQDLISLFGGARLISETITIGTYSFDKIPPVECNALHEPIIINIGSFVQEKNHAFLIDVFYAFYKKEQKGYLWLIGEGKLLDNIKARVNSLGLGERVKFWGYQRNPIPILKRASVMVITSTIEGLPGVLLEAFSCHIPVIASAVGGIPEVIKHKENGYLMYTRDTNSYVKSIEEILHDEDLKNRLTENAFAKFKQFYEMQHIATQFTDLYKRII